MRLDKSKLQKRIVADSKRKGVPDMFQRSSIVIDPKKSKGFVQFLRLSAKDKRFWENVKKGASVKVDKKELDGLFEGPYAKMVKR